MVVIISIKYGLIGMCKNSKMRYVPMCLIMKSERY